MSEHKRLQEENANMRRYIRGLKNENANLKTLLQDIQRRFAFLNQQKSTVTMIRAQNEVLQQQLQNLQLRCQQFEGAFGRLKSILSEFSVVQNQLDSLRNFVLAYVQKNSNEREPSFVAFKKNISSFFMY